MKAYPALNAYMTKKGYTSQSPMIEIYDLSGKVIQYMTNVK